MLARTILMEHPWNRTRVKSTQTITRRVGFKVLEVIVIEHKNSRPPVSLMQCIVCGCVYPIKYILKDGTSIWPRRKPDGKHDKVCAFDVKHVSPENVCRYEKNGKHNRFN